VRLTIALVGCGKVADQHVGEIKKLKNVRLVAVCDQEPLMAEQLASRYGVRAYYSDFDRMLQQQKPDVVHITAPPQSHVLLGKQALNAGCHILVEKPLALDLEEAASLIDHAICSNRKMTIGYTYYFDRIARCMRTMIQEDALGEIVHVESFLGYDLSGRFAEPIFADGTHWVRQLPGGLLQNNLDHLLNKITEFINDERPSVHASAWRGGGPLDATLGLPDELRVMISGQTASAYATFSAHARPLAHYLSIFGIKNTMHLDFISGTLTFATTSALPGAIGRVWCSFGQARQYFRESGRNVFRFARSQYDYLDGLNFLLNAFYDSIIHDTPVPIPYTEMLRTSAMMDEIFAQLRGTRLSVQ
jgi:predicted dehydrogenase